MNLPAPLTPPDCDLRGYEFMPLFGSRLFTSEFNEKASDAEFRAGIKLWWAAWQQCPAGSLPDDDNALCRYADLGRDLRTWKRIKQVALRGFIKCSDGRLYHKLLCEEARSAYARRVKERERKAELRSARRNLSSSETTKDVQMSCGTGDGTSAGQDAGHPADRTRTEPGTSRVDRDRTETGQDKVSLPSEAPTRELALFVEVPKVPRPTKEAEAPAELEAAFAEFWAAYPTHAGKDMAKRNFFAAAQGRLPRKDQRGPGHHQPVPVRDMIEGALRYREQVRNWPADRSVKHAQGWLTERRWMDGADGHPDVIQIGAVKRTFADVGLRMQAAGSNAEPTLRVGYGND